MITITAHGPALVVLDELAKLLATTREAPTEWTAPVYSDEAVQDMERLAAQTQEQAERLAAQAETIRELEAKLAKKSRAKKADEPAPVVTLVTAEQIYGESATDEPASFEAITPEHLLPVEFTSLPAATLTPDELVVVLLEDGSVPEARIVRRFGGTDRYEVQVLKDGAGMSVVESTHIRASEQPAEPAITADERQALRDWVTIHGISFATVAEVLHRDFNLGSSADLRASQIEPVKRELLKHAASVPF